MNVESFREYCVNLPGVTESFPFDDTALVFKVMGKMFALALLEGEKSVNLKCDPERAIELREEFSDILPGYHMNKKHWNTLLLSGDLKTPLIKELINHSYDLVVAGLTKKQKEELLRIK